VSDRGEAARARRAIRWVAAQRVLVATSALLAAGAGSASSAAPADADLEELMRGMAATPGVVAPFREVKELALLAEPLEVRGTLYFVPPDRLARVTDAPSRSVLVIDGARFSFRNEAGADDVDLSDNPVARAFVTNFLVLFNGDLEALRERYATEFRREGERWTLALRPRRRPLSDLVERVVLSGAGRVLDRMEMVEAGGDRTVTSFADVRTDHRFDAAELERLFGAPGATAAP
jgi:outer membrane lipoprotein-sorting protein